MASNNKEMDMSKMFTQLQLAGEDGDYDWGLQVIDEILKVIPDDLDALSCQLVCYIHTSQFNDALQLINKLIKIKGKDIYQYEKAYCLYKLEQYNNSLTVLNSIEEKDTLRVHDLRSQLQYRLGEYELSAQGFHEGSLINASNERTANMSASLCYCTPDTVNRLVSSVPTDTIEQCFNIATIYTLVLNDYNMAETLLRKAEKLCKETEYDEEDDIYNDLIPIHIQLAYTLQLLGRNEESLSLYNSVLKYKPSPLHQLTAANNIIVINCDKDIFDSKKKIKLLSNEIAVKKLNRHQLEIVLYNRCLFSLRINQLEQSRCILQEMKTNFPNTELTLIAQGSLLYREKKHSECITLFEGHLSYNYLSLYLMLSQLYWDIGNHNKAEQVLQQIPHISQYLGVISVLVSLRKNKGEIDKCLTLLHQVLNYWKQSNDDNKRRFVMWETAQFMLECNVSHDAANVLQLLYNEDNNNVKYLAHLISAYSRFDPKKAEELSRSLPSFISHSIDVNNLEQIPTFQVARRPVKTTPSLVASTETMKQKKKKKRKIRLPKNFDPKKPIDPERWLPLRERSYYRKSKKKGQSSVGKGTQGMSASMLAMANKLDASKPKSPDATSEPRVAMATGSGAKGKKGQPSGGQQQRKKKKGKR